MNLTSIHDEMEETFDSNIRVSPWRFDDQPQVVIWVVSCVLVLSLLIPLSIILLYCIKRRRSHTYTVAYRAAVETPPRNLDGGTIRLTRHLSHSMLNQSDRFNTLRRHSIVRLPNSDTLIEYEEEGPEIYL